MEVVCDFQRFYNITIPTDIQHMPAQTLFDLLMGLPRIPGSLYGVWLLEHMPPSDNPSKERSIPFAEWNAQTSMLMDIRNILMGYMAKSKSDDMYVHPPQRDAKKSEEHNTWGWEMYREIKARTLKNE